MVKAILFGIIIGILFIIPYNIFATSVSNRDKVQELQKYIFKIVLLPIQMIFTIYFLNLILFDLIYQKNEDIIVFHKYISVNTQISIVTAFILILTDLLMLSIILLISNIYLKQKMQLIKKKLLSVLKKHSKC